MSVVSTSCWCSSHQHYRATRQRRRWLPVHARQAAAAATDAALQGTAAEENRQQAALAKSTRQPRSVRLTQLGLAPVDSVAAPKKRARKPKDGGGQPAACGTAGRKASAGTGRSKAGAKTAASIGASDEAASGAAADGAQEVGHAVSNAVNQDPTAAAPSGASDATASAYADASSTPAEGRRPLGSRQPGGSSSSSWGSGALHGTGSQRLAPLAEQVQGGGAGSFTATSGAGGTEAAAAASGNGRSAPVPFAPGHGGQPAAGSSMSASAAAVAGSPQLYARVAEVLTARLSERGQQQAAGGSDAPGASWTGSSSSSINGSSSSRRSDGAASTGEQQQQHNAPPAAASAATQPAAEAAGYAARAAARKQQRASRAVAAPAAPSMPPAPQRGSQVAGSNNSSVGGGASHPQQWLDAGAQPAGRPVGEPARLAGVSTSAATSGDMLAAIDANGVYDGPQDDNPHALLDVPPQPLEPPRPPPNFMLHPEVAEAVAAAGGAAAAGFAPAWRASAGDALLRGPSGSTIARLHQLLAEAEVLQRRWQAERFQLVLEAAQQLAAHYDLQQLRLLESGLRLALELPREQLQQLHQDVLRNEQLVVEARRALGLPAPAAAWLQLRVQDGDAAGGGVAATSAPSGGSQAVPEGQDGDAAGSSGAPGAPAPPSIPLILSFLTQPCQLADEAPRPGRGGADAAGAGQALGSPQDP